MIKQATNLTLSGLALLALAPVLPPAWSAEPASYPSQTTFPKENKEAVSRHLSAARRLAGTDLLPEFHWRCLTSPLDRVLVSGVQHDGLIPATRIFDNFYSVGQNAVSAFALDTSDGIILIDALNSPDEARDIIVPNLKALGLDPARIRYVIVTHGHGDHWGGAKYLADTYGAKVVLSDADWKLLESPTRGGGPFRDLVPPKRDVTVKDGDTITLGKTSVKLFVTAGHTPGALSMIFPVTDKGVRHMAGLMGGTGGGQNVATWKQQVASLVRWQGIVRAAKVDVAVTNHPAHMAANERQALIRYARPGDSNPYVFGADRYQRFMGIQTACARVALGRLGETGN
jgi:metallo-beta-lactamase class B